MAHDAHCWDNGATPLPIFEMRANGAQATFLQAVLRLLVCEVSVQNQKKWCFSWFTDTPFVTHFAIYCSNQLHVIGTHVSVAVMRVFSKSTQSAAAAGRSSRIIDLARFRNSSGDSLGVDAFAAAKARAIFCEICFVVGIAFFSNPAPDY